MLVSSLAFKPWRWRRHAPPKYRLTYLSNFGYILEICREPFWGESRPHLHNYVRTGERNNGCNVSVPTRPPRETDAVSRRLPTAAARVRDQVRSYGICSGQSGTGVGFSTNCSTHHHLSSGAGTNRPVADVPSGLRLTPLRIIITLVMKLGVMGFLNGTPKKATVLL
jgi:hypothetical protein